MRRALFVIALGLACSKSEEAQRSDWASPPDRAIPTATAGPDLTTAPATRPGRTATLGAVALPEMEDCVRSCVERNQMRAVAPEQIEADCRRECREQCNRSCEAAAQGRPLQFEQDCRRDCEQQLDKLRL